MAHLLTNDSIQLVTLRTADAGKVLDLLLKFEHAVVNFSNQPLSEIRKLTR